MTPEVLPGRECGSCNVCCVALTIEDRALNKPQGHRCKNAQPDNRCGIYPDRPQTCRIFNCGWRILKWVKPGLRPDQSGVLIQLHGQVSARDGSTSLGIVVTLLNEASLEAEGLAETIAAAVYAGVPVYLNIAGPPGFTSAQAQIDDALGPAVHARDKAAVLAILRSARKQGLTGQFVPLVFDERKGHYAAAETG